MNEDAFNMSMRKYLKQVGVTSQQQIEQAVRNASGPGPFRIRTVVTIEDIGLEHTVEGKISTGDGDTE